VSDKVNAARAAWALIKLSGLGTRPVYLGQMAERVGLEPEEALRLLRLTWRDRLSVHEGEIRLDTAPHGPRRYHVSADGQQVGSGKGCSVDMYLLALALGKPIHAQATCPATAVAITVDITPERVERIDPPTAVVAVTDLDFDITGGPDHTDSQMCSRQPFFASAQAATGWLAAHPQGRLIPVRDFHAEARRLVAWLEAAPANTPP
jgi:alkylmercury lyase